MTEYWDRLPREASGVLLTRDTKHHLDSLFWRSTRNTVFHMVFLNTETNLFFQFTVNLSHNIFLPLRDGHVLSEPELPTTNCDTCSPTWASRSRPMNAPGKQADTGTNLPSRSARSGANGLGFGRLYCLMCRMHGFSITALQYYLLSKVRTRKSLPCSATSLHKAFSNGSTVLIGK